MPLGPQKQKNFIQSIYPQEVYTKNPQVDYVTLKNFALKNNKAKIYSVWLEAKIWDKEYHLYTIPP